MKKAPCLVATLLVLVLFGSNAQASTLAYPTVEEASMEETLVWLETHSPKIMADLALIREVDTNIYLEVVDEAAMEIVEAEELRTTEPEMFKFVMETEELEVRSIRLAVQLSVEKDAGKQTRMRKEIRSLVEQVFEQRMKQHEIIVQEVERELAELKKAGEVRRRNSDKVIERRYEYLIDPHSEALEWW